MPELAAEPIGVALAGAADPLDGPIRPMLTTASIATKIVRMEISSGSYRRAASATAPLTL